MARYTLLFIPSLHYDNVKELCTLSTDAQKQRNWLDAQEARKEAEVKVDLANKLLQAAKAHEEQKEKEMFEGGATDRTDL